MQNWLQTQPELIEKLRDASQRENARMMLVLFFSASLCMPHVFHMLFAENPSGKKLYGAGWGLATGAVLYFLIERTHILGFTPDPEAPGVEPVKEH